MGLPNNPLSKVSCICYKLLDTYSGLEGRIQPYESIICDRRPSDWLDPHCHPDEMP